MSSIVSLRNWLLSYYQSATTAYAAGIAAGFSAWCAVRGGDGVQTDISQFFGNSDDAATGWRFRRLADVAAASPQSRLVPLAFQVFSTASITLIARVPISLWVGRVFLLGATYTGFAGFINVYVNGVRLTVPLATGGALVPGNSRLTYGVRQIGGANDSRDELIGAAYSSYVGADDAARDTLHAAVFNQFKKQSSGSVMLNALTEAAAETGQTVPREAVYDSYKNRGPFLTTPVTLANEGTNLTAGDLTITNAATPLEVQVDTSPDYSGATLIP